MTGIADTGFLLAFLIRTDLHHAWAMQVAARVSEPLLTCEAVLAETSFQVGDVEAGLALIRKGLIKLAFNLDREADNVAWLAARYRDHAPDLADLCLVRMSELYPKHSVLTVDVKDFRIYRRNRREMIPLIHPPVV